MTYIPLGTVIYMAFKPLLKIYLSAALGFLSVKIGILTNEGTAVISQMVLTFFMPCLIFSNVVGNIQIADLKYFGILCLTAALYISLGAVWSYVVRFTTPVPKAWIGGMMLATILNNSGDLPIAYVQTIGNSSYFNSDSTSLGTAYCVLYGIGFNLFLFNLGGSRILIRDADVRQQNKFEPTVPWLSFKRVKMLLGGKQKQNDVMRDTSSEAITIDSSMSLPHTEEAPVNLHSGERLERLSFVSARTHVSENYTIEDMVMSSDVVTTRRIMRNRSNSQPAESFVDILKDEEKAESKMEPEKIKKRFAKLRRAWSRFRHMNKVTAAICMFLENLIRIQALTVILSLLVAFVPWLRRLFVDDPRQVVHGIPNAPDGKPPLDFLMGTVQFMGECQVQLGLFLLGGTIARLKVKALAPGFWKTMLSIGIFKLVLLPIFAVFWISRVKKLGWVGDDMPMFPIVMAACSGTPSATSQIYLTLMYTVDPNDAAQQLNFFGATLIANYIALPITMTVLMSYTVKNFV